MQANAVFSVLKNLFMAFFNATLILIAVCLWFAWEVSGSLNSVVTQFGQRLVSLEPVRGDVRALTDEIAGLREELSVLRQNSQEHDLEALQRVQSKITSLGEQASVTFENLNALTTQPEILIDHAIDSTSLAIKRGLQDVMQCQPEIIESKVKD